MKPCNMYYYIGIFLSIFVGFIVALPNFINAFSINNLATIPKELRISHQLGIIDLENTSIKHLKRNISTLELSNMLIKYLNLLGIPNTQNLKHLQENKILTFKNPQSSISRKAAIEALCRLLIYLSDLGIIRLDESKPTKFIDYSAAEKYQKQFSWLREKQVVKGYNNYFYPNKNLTKLEAIYLLYRLYESISIELSQNRSIENNTSKENVANNKIYFIDIPLDHPIISKLELLWQKNIFKYVQKNKILDGESGVFLVELFGILRSLAEVQLNLDKKLININEFTKNLAKKNLQVYSTRKDFLIALAYLLKKANFSVDTNQLEKIKLQYNIKTKFSEDVILSLAYLDNLKIHFGYNSNNIAFDELINWYELIHVVYDIIIKSSNQNYLDPNQTIIESKDKIIDNEISNNGIENDRLARKEDLEEFVTYLKSAKARINKILNYNTSKLNRND